MENKEILLVDDYTKFRMPRNHLFDGFDQGYEVVTFDEARNRGLNDLIKEKGGHFVASPIYKGKFYPLMDYTKMCAKDAYRAMHYLAPWCKKI